MDTKQLSNKIYGLYEGSGGTNGVQCWKTISREAEVLPVVGAFNYVSDHRETVDALTIEAMLNANKADVEDYLENNFRRSVSLNGQNPSVFDIDVTLSGMEQIDLISYENERGPAGEIPFSTYRAEPVPSMERLVDAGKNARRRVKEENRGF